MLNHFKIYYLGLLYLLSNPLLAQTSFIDVQLSDKTITLNAQQISLSKILTKVSQVSGVLIHHSNLSEQLINRHCVVENIAQLMECIFTEKVNTVFRLTQYNKLAELWLLNIDTKNLALDYQIIAVQTSKNNLKPKNEIIKQLIKQTQHEKAMVRAQAIVDLVKHIQTNNTIEKILINALSDNDAQVRAQAVNALAKTSHANDILQSALLDKDSSVRLMVIDNAGNNMALLQQAHLDTDETVRAYAQMKLAEFK